MTSKAQARPFVFRRNHIVLTALLLLAGLMLIPQHAHAAAGAGGGMPWENPLDQLRASITGPFAFVISILGIVVSFGILIFGGELNAFFRTALLIVMVVSVLVAAQNWLGSTFGKGAEIAAVHLQMLVG